VLAQWLIDKGVPKKDIVLAFQAPARRELMPEFAMMREGRTKTWLISNYFIPFIK
jgi:hypothetical protein